MIDFDHLKAKKYADDPLNWHGGLKARWTNAILNTMEDIQKNISALKTPFFVAHGDDDQLVKIDSSIFLYENSPSKDKTFKVYKNCRHEILNELEESAATFLKDILEWIEQRLPVVLQI